MSNDTTHGYLNLDPDGAPERARVLARAAARVRAAAEADDAAEAEAEATDDDAVERPTVPDLKYHDPLTNGPQETS